MPGLHIFSGLRLYTHWGLRFQVFLSISMCPLIPLVLQKRKKLNALLMYNWYYAYQDRIISFLAFGWAGLFLMVARKMDSDLIKFVLIIGLVAILALLINTSVTDFDALTTGVEPKWFLIITGGLFIYWVFLVIYSRERIGVKK